MSRLFDEKSGNTLVIALDHPIGWGVLPGIDAIKVTMKMIVSAKPNAVTILKGTAEKVFTDYAGTIPFICKLTTFSPHHPAYDTKVGDVIEAVRLGADGVAVGCTVGGKDQRELLSQLSELSGRAAEFGMPTATHIYPKGEYIDKEDWYSLENVMYAARAAAELGIDIIKTFYTGDPKSYAKVIESCPGRVVVSGGPKLPDVQDVFRMTHDAIQVGARGVTFGRNVWQSEKPIAMIQALKSIIHEKGSVKGAMEIFNQGKG
jgi:DhnA family fructose-bisphosphate aldolase class Ia